MTEPPQITSSLTGFIPTTNYDLAATLNSGQAFGWTFIPDHHIHRSDSNPKPPPAHQNTAAAGSWVGVIEHHWVRLQQDSHGLKAQVAASQQDWSWLTDYLQTAPAFDAIVATFPPDPHLERAVQCCHGLRILRQAPWECLASFLLSSTKRISQIRQVHSRLRQCLGQPLRAPPGYAPAFAFPSPDAIAEAGESALRQCGMGFRAPYLLEAARQVSRGDLDLPSLRHLSLTEGRAQLTSLPGVGPKIADCVLLFSCDQPRAFPIDVWIARTLRSLYFQNQPLPLSQLHAFAASHFGPHAGHAQQLLFHYARFHASSPL